MKYADIPKLTKSPSYHIDLDLRDLKHWIKSQQDDFGDKMKLDPDFQRAHVWDETKQQRYIEYILRGGQSALDFHFNCADYRLGSLRYDLVLVDGKQRLNAIFKYINNELTVFDGHYAKDFDRLRMADVQISIYINDLKTRKEVLQWYIDMNSGGVAHTDEEIQKVKDLLAKED